MGLEGVVLDAWSSGKASEDRQSGGLDELTCGLERAGGSGGILRVPRQKNMERETE